MTKLTICVAAGVSTLFAQGSSTGLGTPGTYVTGVGTGLNPSNQVEGWVAKLS